MKSKKKNSTIVVVDDELYNLVWLLDYLRSKKYDVLPAKDANEALEILEGDRYRCVIVDLNIPMYEPFVQAVGSLGNVYVKFPGLFVAREARTKGYRDRQVIIYSVHRDVEVAQEAKILGCTYILKGRPKEMKLELDDVLRYDPS